MARSKKYLGIVASLEPDQDVPAGLSSRRSFHRNLWRFALSTVGRQRCSQASPGRGSGTGSTLSPPHRLGAFSRKRFSDGFFPPCAPVVTGECEAPGYALAGPRASLWSPARCSDETAG